MVTTKSLPLSELLGVLKRLDCYEDARETVVDAARGPWPDVATVRSWLDDAVGDATVPLCTRLQLHLLAAETVTPPPALRDGCVPSGRAATSRGSPRARSERLGRVNPSRSTPCRRRPGCAAARAGAARRAHLCDNVPNMAGLVRTTEVLLGASAEVTLRNDKVLRDAHFLKMPVAAEKCCAVRAEVFARPLSARATAGEAREGAGGMVGG